MRQTRKPRWRPEELVLLGEIPDRELAQRINRSVSAVSWKRLSLGISGYQTKNRRAVEWTEDALALLGTASDREIAARLGVLPETVFQQRAKRGIAAHQGAGGRVCSWCGERFVADSAREKYCNTYCRNQAVRHRYMTALAATEMTALAAELEGRLADGQNNPEQSSSSKEDVNGPQRRTWREIRGSVPYPLCGEDAQAWVSRGRRESHEHRETNKGKMNDA